MTSNSSNMDQKSEFKLFNLNQENYVAWKWQFKNVMKARNLSKVFGEESVSDSTDAQALAILGSALNEENILKIINCITFKEAWKAIEACYENKTTYEPQALYRRLNSFKISSAREVSSGISEMKGIVAQLKNLNEDVSDNCLIGAILSALPDSFSIFTTVWKNSSDKNVDSLVSKVMAEAVDQIKAEPTTNALMVKPDSNKPLEKDQCKYCKEIGHWIKDCPNLKTPYDPERDEKNRKRKQQQEKGDEEQRSDERGVELSF